MSLKFLHSFYNAWKKPSFLKWRQIDKKKAPMLISIRALSVTQLLSTDSESTEHGTTSNPTMRQPGSPSGLWIFTVNARWLYTLAGPQGVSTKNPFPLSKPLPILGEAPTPTPSWSGGGMQHGLSKNPTQRNSKKTQNTRKETQKKPANCVWNLIHLTALLMASGSNISGHWTSK